jgi:hypothetical protein
MPVRRIIRAVLPLLALGSCGCTTIEVARVPFSSVGQANTVVELAPGDVAFWTHFDASFSDDMSALIGVTLVQQGAVVAQAICDPVHPRRICTTRYKGITDHAWTCKMACTARVKHGGETAVWAWFKVLGGPPDLRLNAADLIVRQ